MSAGATVRTIALHSLHSITAISPPDYSTQTAPAVWISEVRIRNGCDKLTIRSPTRASNSCLRFLDLRPPSPSRILRRTVHRIAENAQRRSGLLQDREAKTAPSEKYRGETSQNRYVAKGYSTGRVRRSQMP
jgi:hypothetical protein